ncbi:MAG: Gfo/Idh/MocA family oxidoreductase [Armatimonadetes bacterium]|nr:Gfo/Idh/MocA family oxidoreductase [Armatimonadota bacterium]
MKLKATRREFLKKTALATGATFAAPYLIPRSVRAQEGKLGVAVIGAGGMGGYAVDLALRERCVALCDIDDGKLAEALKKATDRAPDLPAPKAYADFRVLLEECANDLDVVLISTPDHTHAPAAIRAIDLGKPVFVQKPMAHNIRECAVLAKAAKDKGVLTQMGNQGHCSGTFRRACEELWAGAVGNVTETHSLLGRNFGGTGTRPETKPVPPGVHWDEWLGPAPYRDYHDGLHPFGWRNWRDFGTGSVGDMACHNVDCVFFGLKVYEAKTYTIECLNTNGGSEEMCAQDNVVRYDIPARADMPPVQVYVYDHGGLKSEVMKEAEKEFGIELGEDTLYIGDKGHYLTGGHASSARILDEARAKEFGEPPKVLPEAHGGPIEDLYFGIRNGTSPVSNFPDSATPLTAFVLSALLAQRAGVGKKVEWDVEKTECTNMPELNEYVGRTYRSGWEV